MWKSRLKTLVCAVALFAAISCGSSASNRGQRGNSNSDDSSKPAVTIKVGKSESRDIASSIEATGSLTANETSGVAPKVAGKIANISVNVGQFVAGGAVLARIDDRDARLKLASAQVAVKQAEAGVRQAQARLGLLDGGKFEA